LVRNPIIFLFQMRTSWRGAAALVLYGGLVALIWGSGGVLSDPRHYNVGGGNDPTATMWFLCWWPYALAHRLNPFISKLVWAPRGVNLTWSTSIPALSALAFPITCRLGPVVAYNVLSLLAPIVSGLSAYWFCSYLVSSYWPAVVGGWIYGFSTYQTAEEIGGHLSLSVSFIPPLCALIFIRRLRNEIGRWGFVLTLFALLAFQFLISNEIFTTMTVFGMAAIVLAGIFGDRALRRRLFILTVESGVSFLCAAVAVAPFLYYMFRYDLPHGPLYPPETYSTDLLGFVLPNNLVYIHAIVPGVHIESYTFLSQAWERNAYITWPVIAMIALYARRNWKSAQGKLILSLLGVIYLASMGPRLHIMDRATIPLPWAVAAHLPLLEHALPGRFMLFVFLVLAVVISAWLAADKVRTSLKLLLVAMTVLLSWPAALTSQTVSPAFFADGLYARYLPRNPLVMVVPYGEAGASMLWQAQSGMYFRMAGGWTGPTPPEFRDWPVVKGLLMGVVVPPAQYQLEAFLGRYQVGAVLVADSDTSAWKPVIATLDPNPAHAGGVTLYKVPRPLFEIFREASANQAEQTALLTMWRETLSAVNRYLESGGDLHDLSIERLRAKGLIPERGETASLARRRGVPENVYVAPAGKDTFVMQAWGLPSTVERIDRLYGAYDCRTRAASPQHIFLVKPDYGSATVVFDRAGLKRATALLSKTANTTDVQPRASTLDGGEDAVTIRLVGASNRYSD
jgi:hypothetical protein